MAVLFGQLRDLAELPGDIAVAFPPVGQETGAAILDAVADIAEVAAAPVAQGIQRTVAEQAVEVLRMGGLVAGKELAGRVLEEGVAALLGLGGQGLTLLNGAPPLQACRANR